MRLYLDSNVFISFVRSEMDDAFNPRGMQSEQFFSVCRERGIELVLSGHFMHEVKKIAGLEQSFIMDTFKLLDVYIVFMKENSTNHSRKIFRETGIHLEDAIHVANAIEQHCDAIITWNIKDFQKVEKIISCFDPARFVQGIPSPTGSVPSS